MSSMDKTETYLRCKFIILLLEVSRQDVGLWVDFTSKIFQEP